MSAEPQTTTDVTPNPMTDLSGFQRELLVALESLGEKPKGLTVKDRWEAQNEDTTTTGRVYPNLDELVDGGYVIRGEKDRRTNFYEITADGKEALADYRSFISGE